MPSLGKFIRLARLEAELSLNDLATCIDVSPTTLASWERDLEAPVRENLLRLSLQFPDLIETLQDGEGRP